MSLTFNELPVYFTVSAETSYDLRSTDAAVRDAEHGVHNSSDTDIQLEQEYQEIAYWVKT